MTATKGHERPDHRFSEKVMVTMTPQMREKIEKISQEREIPMTRVTRVLIRRGLKKVR